jgi:hypothetical protein
MMGLNTTFGSKLTMALNALDIDTKLAKKADISDVYPRVEVS